MRTSGAEHLAATQKSNGTGCCHLRAPRRQKWPKAAVKQSENEDVDKYVRKRKIRQQLCNGSSKAQQCICTYKHNAATDTQSSLGLRTTLTMTNS